VPESLTIVSTAAIADASLRIGVPVRSAPTSLVPIAAGLSFSGPARPVTHLGSVDVLLETIDDAPVGSVLVVDNGGRHDEACVGDLMILEAKMAGLCGAVIWGRHRDHKQLLEIGLPVHSLGTFSFGPRRVPPAGAAMRSAYLDGAAVSNDDVVFADDDGVLFVHATHVDALVAAALEIEATESAQAERMHGGDSLRNQLDFATYRADQAANPTLTLREHLAKRGGAIEV
jgi:4-hydroxy-4-methyl-2-oxoglutarate aldolase